MGSARSTGSAKATQKYGLKGFAKNTLLLYIAPSYLGRASPSCLGLRKIQCSMGSAKVGEAHRAGQVWPRPPTPGVAVWAQATRPGRDRELDRRRLFRTNHLTLQRVTLLLVTTDEYHWDRRQDATTIIRVGASCDAAIAYAQLLRLTPPTLDPEFTKSPPHCLVVESQIDTCNLSSTLDAGGSSLSTSYYGFTPGTGPAWGLFHVNNVVVMGPYKRALGLKLSTPRTLGDKDPPNYSTQRLVTYRPATSLQSPSAPQAQPNCLATTVAPMSGVKSGTYFLSSQAHDSSAHWWFGPDEPGQIWERLSTGASHSLVAARHSPPLLCLFEQRRVSAPAPTLPLAAAAAIVILLSRCTFDDSKDCTRCIWRDQGRWTTSKNRMTKGKPTMAIRLRNSTVEETGSLTILAFRCLGVGGRVVYTCVRRAGVQRDIVSRGTSTTRVKESYCRRKRTHPQDDTSGLRWGRRGNSGMWSWRVVGKQHSQTVDASGAAHSW
ncbi:hypothetical protein CPB85DRAFT_1253696 [Mucidula mucida]|nr:hypothetical protein CPB85DRAFT_1253696 [Mucidula mucida]